jgi:hypothetical protein
MAYFSRHLPVQNIECTKHNRQVKPKYYGEGLTRDKIIERMEEDEREKGEKKAQKKSREDFKAC